MLKQITSLQNTSIKRLIQLQEKSRVRKKEQGFIIEGQRELELAVKGGYVISEVYFVEDFVELDILKDILSDVATEIVYVQITKEVYRKLAYRDSTEGVIAFAKAKSTTLSALSLNQNPLLLIAEAPEKPGNIGALLRTADAAGADAFIITNPKTDIYNPNIIRSSVGCVFTNQIGIGTTEEVIEFLKEQHIKPYTAILQEAKPYTQEDYKGSSAIVVGTEATGLSDIWRTIAMHPIKIPMQGTIDSMNVSVAAGILLFEAVRQRSLET